MRHISSAARSVFCSLKMHHVVILAVAAFTAVQPAQSAAQAPTISLTQIGSPIWRPVDFQIFSAPDDQTTRALLRGPNDPPADATTYTTPHGPPYDSELSTNMAAAGFVSRSVFPREAIARNPNAIFLPLTLVPDPGITGSSRDFASGPVIPDSLFPLSGHNERWHNGVLADTGDFQTVLRPTDLPFEGASHRILFSTFFNTGADNFGNYELRSSMIDAEGNGWDMVFPFKVVRAGDFDEDGDVDLDDFSPWTGGFGTSSGALHAEGDADFDGDADGTDFLAWQRELGQTSALAAAESTVPEPSTFILAGAGLIAWTFARRRRTA